MPTYLYIITIILFTVLIVGVPILIGKIQSTPVQKIGLVLGFYVIITFLGYLILNTEQLFYPFVIAAAFEASWRFWREKKQSALPSEETNAPSID